jgi:hypothetical protein
LIENLSWFLRLTQHVDGDAAAKLPSHTRLELRLPAAFPEKYRTAIVRAAEGCKVKKTIAAAPVIDVLAPCLAHQMLQS